MSPKVREALERGFIRRVRWRSRSTHKLEDAHYVLTDSEIVETWTQFRWAHFAKVINPIVAVWRDAHLTKPREYSFPRGLYCDTAIQLGIRLRDEGVAGKNETSFVRLRSQVSLIDGIVDTQNTESRRRIQKSEDKGLLNSESWILFLTSVSCLLSLAISVASSCGLIYVLRPKQDEQPDY